MELYQFKPSRELSGNSLLLQEENLWLASWDLVGTFIGSNNLW
jgi:hypothetical protein